MTECSLQTPQDFKLVQKSFVALSDVCCHSISAENADAQHSTKAVAFLWCWTSLSVLIGFLERNHAALFGGLPWA